MNMKLGGFVFCALVSFLVPAFAADQFNCKDCHTNVTVHSPKHKGVACNDCHSNISKIPHQAKPLKSLGGDAICAQCHNEQIDNLKKSVHNGNGCVSCHQSPHQAFKAPMESCTGCHDKTHSAFLTSTHSKKGVTCKDCHGNLHTIIKTSDPNSPVSPVGQVDTCRHCHDPKIVQGYLQSQHGRGVVLSGLSVAPTCSTCHGSHAIYAKNNPHSKISETHLPETCGSCHKFILDKWKQSIHGKLWQTQGGGPVCSSCHTAHDIQDPRLAINRMKIPERCEGCHAEQYETYRDTFHGKATDLGYVTAATCSDCHTPHSNLKANDPNSTVHPNNLKRTCANCHGEVSARFIKFDPHMNPKDAKRNPAVHYIWLFMTILLVGTFGFFAIHTFLWLQRAIVAFIRGEIKPIHREGEVWVRRFLPVHQWMHATVVTTFLLLALTGLPLKFHSVAWATVIAKMLGGIGVTRFIHHLAGVVTFGYAAFFVSYLFNEIVVKRRYELLWGWKSMTPNPKDLIDAFHNIRWFLYMGKPPKLGRWAYWEKFDFFAVFWGVPVIGFSGLMLWFPRVFTSLVPGWALNIAALVHGDEALLATGFIFFFHFFHSHMRPENFPMDPVIFTGRMPMERFMEERPDEYEKLKASGELDKYIVPPPSELNLRVTKIFGFSALTLGVILGTLLLYAGSKLVFGL